MKAPIDAPDCDCRRYDAIGHSPWCASLKLSDAQNERIRFNRWWLSRRLPAAERETAWAAWQGHAADGVQGTVPPSSDLVADLYKVAMFGDRGNHAKLAERIREVLATHGVSGPDHQTKR
jgi:hypothetical protein